MGNQRDATTGQFLARDATDRLMAKVVVEDRGHETPCWTWQGGVSALTGYGSFWLDGRTTLAHRAAYVLLVGPVPDGLELDHLCRQRVCVRPLHLEAVTPQENQHRGNSPWGINSRLTQCRRGHPFTGIWRGRRTCRACSVIRTRAYRARLAA